MTGIVHHTSLAVTTTLDGITKTVSTATQAIDMLELYVRKAKLDQADAHVVHRKTSRLYLLEAAAKERSIHQEALASEMYANPQRKALFDANYAELAALFD